MEQYLQVGVISSTHGIKGEVKVFPTTDDPGRFKKLKEVILDTGREQLSLEVQDVKFLKKLVVLKFKGIDDINDIEKYKGKPLLITREQAVPLNKDEYFIADLIGLKVQTKDNDQFGILKDVMVTGANDVYVIESKEHGEVLVPAIKECIRKIDLDSGIIEIHLLKGLI